MINEPIDFDPPETPLGDELEGDNWHSQHDNAPNPYEGTYSEE